MYICLTYHLAPSVLNAIGTSPSFILPLVVFPKALFSALYSSSCTSPLSVLISSVSLDHHLCADDTQLFSLSTHSTLTQAFLTFKTLINRSLPGWLLIFLLLTLLRLNSCSSDSKTNLPKYTTLHSTPPTLLDILASSLTNILLSLTKLHLSKACYYHIRQLCSIRPYLDSSTASVCLYHCYLYRPLQTRLL